MSKMSRFRFTRLHDGQKIRSEKVQEVLRFPDAAQERWLFVSPHDDDVAIGGAMWVDAAVLAGVHIEVLIVTDGRMGYCSAEERESIVQIRKEETYKSFELLGVGRKHVEYIGYPDGGLYDVQGRREARGGGMAIAGFVGLQNAMTWHLRRVRPTRLFIPSSADLHPDHRITYQELMISIFHANGAIWPELGKPTAKVPTVYDMAVYCDFAEPPNLELRGDDAAFDKKLASIAAYKSQAQIEAIVQNLRGAGAYEYLREVAFPIYHPDKYRRMFE
jgi:LmbE family N-acetylglucosaminyl deacetylase